MLDAIGIALAEDVGPGDLTTAAVVPEGATAIAVIEQRAPGVPAGLAVAEEVFRRVDGAIEFRAFGADGGWREASPLAEVSGPAAGILTAERTALNFLGRLSGVATLSHRYVQAVAGTRARILDTRKTTPGLRELEKQAVRAGGGTNHRMGLFDAVLIKENHAALAGGVGEATRTALARAPAGVAVEVECRTLDEVDDAVRAGAGRILLDNMDPLRLREAVERVGARAELEASGGITLDNVRAVAESGVDWISVGALTHSAPTLDLGLVLRSV